MFNKQIHKEEIFAQKLNKRYTFENFILGDENKATYNSAISFAKNCNDLSYFNPLIIYGGSGLGKTHLVSAIGNDIINKYPTKKIIYMQSDDFIHNVVFSIRGRSLEMFYKFFKEFDIIIIEDIQLFAGKEKSLEVFTDLFKEVYRSGSKLVLTFCDKDFKDSISMDLKLLHIFKNGMTSKLYKPNIKVREAIIRQKVFEFNTHNLPDDRPFNLDSTIIELLSKKIDVDIRYLEGAVKILFFRFVCSNRKQSFSLQEFDTILFKK